MQGQSKNCLHWTQNTALSEQLGLWKFRREFCCIRVSLPGRVVPEIRNGFQSPRCCVLYSQILFSKRMIVRTLHDDGINRQSRRIILTFTLQMELPEPKPPLQRPIKNTFRLADEPILSLKSAVASNRKYTRRSLLFGDNCYERKHSNTLSAFCSDITS